jgi:hypothetical protein
MADQENPWPDLVAAANARIRQANEGNTLAAQEVLRQAVVGLRDVLAGRLPDPERSQCLKYLVDALEQIAMKVPAEKALGLWSGNRPHSVSDSRDLASFVRVGLELNRQPGQPVSAAIGAAAKRLNLGKSTVEKAWKKYGGRREWMRAMDPEVPKGK